MLPASKSFQGVTHTVRRYRCLEAIAKGAFPNEPTATTADLLALGERMQFQMPDLSVIAPKKIEELTKFREIPPDNHQPPPAVESAPPKSTGSQEPENNPKTAQHQQAATARLVRDAAGRVHYIGPSGSLSFFAELRDLVSSYEQNPQHGDNSRSKFALDNIAEALETEDRDQNGAPEDVNDPAHREVASPESLLSTCSNHTGIVSHLDLDEQLRRLPPRDIMEALIISYFDHCHDDLPLFHRATFQDEYESFTLSAQRARLGGAAATNDSQKEPDHGWLACLHMMLVFGFISLPEMSNFSKYNVQRVSVATASSFLPVLTTKCVLSNIQSLLLLCFYFHNNNDRNAAWNLVGTATRMSFALGLHQNDLDSQFRPIERETRKRIWCTLFTFEQFLCSSLGRPSGIGDPDVEVRVPKEAFLDGGYGAGERFSEENLKLQYILSSARRFMGVRYQSHTPNSLKWASKTIARKILLQSDQATSSLTTENIFKELESWCVGLPSHLQLPNITTYSTNPNGETSQQGMSYDDLKLSLSRSNPRQLRALILLHIQYQYIIMLISRPALLVEIASSSTTARDCGPASPGTQGSGPSSARSLTVTSVAAAVQISSLTLLLDDFNLLNGTSGLDIFYAYCSAMVLLLRTLWVQHTNKQSEIDQESERRESLLALVAKLRAVVGKAKKSKTSKRFADVMNKFGDVVGNINSSRALAGSRVAQHIRAGAERTAPLPAPTATPGQVSQVQRISTAFDQGLRSPDQIHQSTGRIKSVIYPNNQPPSIQGNNLLDHHQWQSMGYPFSPVTAMNSSQSYGVNASANASANAIGGDIPNSTGTFDASVNESLFWYNDPLDALAYGHVVDWTELDTLVGGQLD